MALPLDSVLGGWIYRGFALLTIAGISGTLLAARSSAASEDSDRIARRHISIIFTAAVPIALLAFFYYNLEFLQWQGRYLFPALIPVALSLVAGIDAWRARLFARWEPSRWLTSLAMMCLFALDIYLLFRVIVPGLSP